MNAKVEQKTEWKRATIPFVDLKVGGSVEGVLIGPKKVGERINPQTGEVADRFCLVLKKPGTEEKFQINYTAGLKNALQNSECAPGDEIKINRLEKTKMQGKPGEVNQYDIFNRG